MAQRKQYYAQLRRYFRRVPPVRMLGIRLSKLSPGQATLILDSRPRHAHSEGIHGGILATLADTALAAAILTRVRPPARIATVELKINYLSIHARGQLRAEARVLRLGKRWAVGEVEIRNAKRTLVAKSLLTYSVRPAAGKQRERTRTARPSARRRRT